MNTRPKTCINAFLVLLLSIAASPVMAQVEDLPGFLSPSETWFFGSSTTDTGEFQAALALIPEPPYFEGRFSNGPVWADYFSDYLGTDATASSFGGTNYAFGGARTDVVVFGIIPPITSQVDDYLERVNFVADPNALYAFQTAANDLTAAKLEAPEDAKQIMLHAVDATHDMLADLYDAGARKFLLLNIPELPTAEVSAILPDGTNLAQLTNDGFDDIEEYFESLGAFVRLVDLHGLVDEVVEEPGVFGIEVTECSYMGKSSTDIIFGDLVPEPCEPLVPVAQYMMFDDQHYTTVMQSILAHEAIEELCAGSFPSQASQYRPCIVRGQ